MKFLNNLSGAVLYLGLLGFMNNISWIIADKAENFDDWWYYKLTTIFLYTAAIFVYKLEEIAKNN